MKKIALVLSAFAVLAFSGVVRAEEGKAEAPKTEKEKKAAKKPAKTEAPAGEKTEKKTETK